MIGRTGRLALVTATVITAAALGCVGPQGSHRDGNSWPTGPQQAPVFELFGVVRDIQTQQPVAGAKIDVGNASGISDSLGLYSLPGLTASFMQVVVSRAGYDTTRIPVTPFPGRVQVTIQMRLTPTTIVAP